MKVQRLSQEEMGNQKRHILYYNYYKKYACSHKCKEHKLFQIDVTDPTHSKEDTPKFKVVNQSPPMQEEGEPKVHREPIIYLHALSSI